MKGGDFIGGICIVFSVFIYLVMFMNLKHEILWSLKKCKLYILCTLILFNPFHLTIGSKLTLIRNEL
jgi:hypothetical protein